MEEIWKDIEGYNGLYQISTKGRVKSLITNRILKPSIKRYSNVVLCKDNKKKYPTIHRLVATSFISNPNNYPIVMHKDNNGNNNDVSNLQWGTHSDNNLYAYQCGNQKYVIEHNSNRFKLLHKQKSKIFKNYA
jgi:hypothetical protein